MDETLAMVLDGTLSAICLLRVELNGGVVFWAFGAWFSAERSNEFGLESALCQIRVNSFVTLALLTVVGIVGKII